VIEKDVVRTDRKSEYFQGEDNPNIERLAHILNTYLVYDSELGMCECAAAGESHGPSSLFVSIVF
jgi:hypothetical protein